MQPAGEREQRLLDLVEGYGTTAEFIRAVSARTHRSPVTEKSAFYRIVRGRPGDRVQWRVRHYASVLGVDRDELADAWTSPRKTPKASEMALLTQIVTRLEEDPQAASGDLAPLLEDLATQLAELSFRLRQAVARQGERWHRG